MRLLTDGVKRMTITENDLPKLLDCQPYPPALHTEKEEIGVVNGLAWTEAGTASFFGFGFFGCNSGLFCFSCFFR